MLQLVTTARIAYSYLENIVESVRAVVCCSQHEQFGWVGGHEGS